LKLEGAAAGFHAAPSLPHLLDLYEFPKVQPKNQEYSSVCYLLEACFCQKIIIASGSIYHTVPEKIELMRNLGYPKEKAESFGRGFWQLPAVRKNQIAAYPEQGDFSAAEKVLLESKEMDKKLPGLVADIVIFWFKYAKNRAKVSC